MLDPSLRDALRAPLTTLKIIWMALLSSLGVYAIVAYMVARDAGAAPEGSSALEALVPALGVSAITCLIGSFVLRSLLRTKAAQRLPNPVDTAALPRLTGAYTTSCIVGWALCESIAIYGLVLFLLSHQWGLFLPFLGLGAVAMLVQAPTESDIANMARIPRG